MDYDVIVVGAGPTGSIVAESIANQGHDVLILEEHPSIGVPTHCTGKISLKAFESLNIKPFGVLNSVKGAVFFSPDLKAFSVKRDKVQAYILDRRRFDEYLCRKAVRAGSRLISKARVTDVVIGSEGVNVLSNLKNDEKHIISRVVVAADGAKATLARRLDMYSKKIWEVRIAAQKEMTEVRDLDTEVVELYFGNKYAPGFFAWIVPLKKDVARVGLCVSPTSEKLAMKNLDEFVKNHPIAAEKLKGSSCVSQSVHVIPTGGPIKETVSDGLVIVGDAAGQVKSTTGGGLYYGMLCAKIAGNVIANALSEDSNKRTLPREMLIEYQRQWQKALGKEIEFGVKARIFFDLLTDMEFNYLFDIFRNKKSLSFLIESEGDIDWQSGVALHLLKGLIKPLMSRPTLLYKLGRAFGIGFE